MTKFLATVVPFLALFYFTSSIGDEEIRCLAANCKKPSCAAVPKQCKSVPDSGLHMLSPDICNCCDYCLVKLVEGEACTVGDPSTRKYTTICGPGLTCVPTNAQSPDGACEQMSTPCALEQQDYDTRREKGLLGTMELKISCDDDGAYDTYKCIPGQSCHCLHSNGSRIFGEANINTISNYMPCGCSRKYYDAVDVLGRSLHPQEHFRCTAEGDYDRLQCINEQCLCVDAADGAPTYPTADLVDLEKISNETLPCYNLTTPGQYYKACEAEYMKLYKELEAKKQKSGYKLFLGYNFPKCDLDGTYEPVQENKTHKYCVDKEGNPLLALDKSNSTLKTVIENMDCKCVRASLVMKTTEKPQCLENGNYNPVQCRRGICRCVDSDGSQKCATTTTECEEEDESQASRLPCWGKSLYI